MPTTIREPILEGSSRAFDFSFTDEANAPATPTALTWTLLDARGNVINERAAVVVAEPAATVTIELAGADLALDDAYYGNVRWLRVDGRYDSATLGADQIIVDVVRFTIQHLAHAS